MATYESHDKLVACTVCGEKPSMKLTDISLVAFVCLTTDCSSPVILAVNPAVGRKKWREQQERQARAVPKTLAETMQLRRMPMRSVPRGYPRMAMGKTGRRSPLDTTTGPQTE